MTTEEIPISFPPKVDRETLARASQIKATALQQRRYASSLLDEQE